MRFSKLKSNELFVSSGELQRHQLLSKHCRQQDRLRVRDVHRHSEDLPQEPRERRDDPAEHHHHEAVHSPGSLAVIHWIHGGVSFNSHINKLLVYCQHLNILLQAEEEVGLLTFNTKKGNKHRTRTRLNCRKMVVVNGFLHFSVVVALLARHNRQYSIN